MAYGDHRAEFGCMNDICAGLWIFPLALSFLALGVALNVRRRQVVVQDHKY